MTNVTEILGKYLELHGFGFYDDYGPNGSIVSGRLRNKQNNQIVLKYNATTNFLGSKGEFGIIEIRVYNSNHRKAVEKLIAIDEAIRNTTIVKDEVAIGISINQSLSDLDVAHETDLLCVNSKYTVEIKN